MTDDSVCRTQRKRMRGNTLDHIEPIDGPDDPRFFDEQGMQWLCATCHQRKRQRESQQPAPRRAAQRDEVTEWG